MLLFSSVARFVQEKLSNSGLQTDFGNWSAAILASCYRVGAYLEIVQVLKSGFFKIRVKIFRTVWIKTKKLSYFMGSEFLAQLSVCTLFHINLDRTFHIKLDEM